MSAMFPTIAVNGNGSSLVQFAYSSAYIHTEINIDTGIDRMFIQADSLDYVSQYIGIMHYGTDGGPGAIAKRRAFVRREGLATYQTNPLLSTEPPLSFGRMSASDTVVLGDGTRRIYGAVPYAYNTPIYTNAGGVLNPENGFNNIGNYITVTGEVFA